MIAPPKNVLMSLREKLQTVYDPEGKLVLLPPPLAQIPRPQLDNNLKVSFAEDIFFSQNMDLREKFRQIERY